MNQSQPRIGNFTSSEIVALTKVGRNKADWGKPALTYINECNMERKLGRSVTHDVTARPLSWGKLLEPHCFDLLGLEYKLCSLDTLLHPYINCWSGSPDGEKFDNGKTVIDIKCPMTLKSFCTMVDCLDTENPIEALRENHSDGEKYYWQLVSNSILTGAKFAELIVYMPYQSELEDIRERARNFDGLEQKNYYWVHVAEDNELPYLLDGWHYKNINVIRFEVPQEDKDFLTNKVIEASDMLLEPFKKI